MGKMVALESETIAREMLSRLPTPDELALLSGAQVEAVIVAKADSARRRHSRLRKKSTTSAQLAMAIDVSVERLEAARAAKPQVSVRLRWWVALHAWRPMSLRHAAKLAGIARGTAATIAAGRVRSEGPDEEEEETLRPKRVRRYYCEGCKKWVYLKPCVICEALKAPFPEPDDEEDDTADANQ